MSAKILIVDDEAPIIDVLSYNLNRANYKVYVAWDGQQALDLARREQPDLIILDLMLPKLDGIEVCRILRRECDVPIIMLTARDEEVDRVVGLELGADDYVVKPFSVRELLARVKNVLRRVYRPPEPPLDAASLIRIGDLVIDAARYEVRLGTVLLDLTALEFKLLHTLAQHAGLVLSREQLLDFVWGYDYHDDLRVVDAVVKRLRAKLRDVDPDAGERVYTVRGVGYKLIRA
ncbi:MAG: response regulator transcription factor [Anaerolineae bacterium]|nr:response regulator transcription factor [Anaerolineae bacterium]